MALPRLASTVVAALLCAAVSFGYGGARAGEAFTKTMLYENGVAVTVIAFSPDGERIAFAVEDRTVRIRETANGNEVAAGVYYYNAKVTFNVVDPTRKVQSIRGWVQVIR